jgi:hypothetical protein
VIPGRPGALLLAALVLLPTAAPALTPAFRVVVTPAEPRPGDVVLLRVPGGPPDLAGEWNGQPLRFFRTPDGPAALVGIDLDTVPAPIAWRIIGGGRPPEPPTVRRGRVTVRPRTFETQRLTLPPHQVDLDAATLARVRAEQGELASVLATGAPTRLWHGRFRSPVDDGRPTGGFGLRRVINGQPRSPHAGFDWAAPRGTPVVAANAGRVALVAEYFFAGRLVLLDHGLGLFTHYYHLDEARVAPDEVVVTGQVIGTVGASGRATGPHLHLGVTLAGARVDPIALLGLIPPEPD